MLLEAIFHKPYSEYSFSEDKNTLVIRLRTKKNDIQVCMLLYHEKYKPSLKGSVQMKKAVSDELFDYYEAKLCVGIKRFKYMFYIEDNFDKKWYNQDGFFNNKPEWGHFCYSHLYSDEITNIEWFENSIIYQVFPDRFSRSRHNKRFKPFYGGNIEGIISKINYLVGLGINVIYLNPVFKSKSYHRYDTIDYYEVDPVFGEKSQIKELIRLCHENNIKLIFDGVFNHCGEEFFAFKDVRTKGKNSEYKDWFYIDSFPVTTYPTPNYECFSYFGGMPKLNTANPQVVQYMHDVVLYWTKEFGVDGWRFDVADEVNRNFFRELRIKIKAFKNDIIFIGEIFDEASSWLDGGQFDSVINYPLKSLTDALFAYRSIDVEVFKMRVNNYIMKFNLITLNSMTNIIGTHDTARFLTLCQSNLESFCQAVVFQFTFPGVPLIYYGDEIGMEGEDDPLCRKPMVWDEDKWNKDIYKLYHFLINLRKNHKPLRNGLYRDITFLGNKGVLAYEREYMSEKIIVIINTTDKDIEGIIDFDNLSEMAKTFKCLKTQSLFKVKLSKMKVDLKPYDWAILSSFHE